MLVRKIGAKKVSIELGDGEARTLVAGGEYNEGPRLLRLLGDGMAAFDSARLRVVLANEEVAVAQQFET